MGQTNQKPIQQYAVLNHLQAQKPIGYSNELINILNKDSPQTYQSIKYEGYDTIWKLFQRTLRRIPNHPFLGQLTKESEKAYEWMTFKQVNAQAELCIKGIHSLDLSDKYAIDKVEYNLIGIYSENRLEWVVTELACISDSVTLVPIYSGHHVNVVEEIISQAELRTLFVSGSTLDTILNLREQGKLQSLRSVVCYDNYSMSQHKRAGSLRLNTYTYDNLMKAGEIAKKIQLNQPKRDTLFIIAYTSGTQGDVKGSMLTHFNMISGFAHVEYLDITFNESDSYLSYVPLSHIMEQIMLVQSITLGFKIGFSSGDRNKLITEVNLLKPTIFGSFPAFYNKLYKMSLSKVSEKSERARKIFQNAIANKSNNFISEAIFKKIRNMLGGNIRCFVSGGAPMNQEVFNFIKIVFGCKLIECYGATETAGYLCGTSANETTAGIVGGPLPCIKLRLKDLPELGFTSDSNPPKGEICVKGDAVFKGYFRNKALTEQAFDEDGWFRTGDIGQILPNGSIQIIDRLKQICKLQHGWYVGPQYLENKYLQIKYISQIFVSANSRYSGVAGIIVIDRDTIPYKALELGVISKDQQQTIDFDNLVKNEKIFEFIKSQLEAKEQEHQLQEFERISQRFHLQATPFTVDNGILNQSMKIRRFEAENIFKDIIEEIHQRDDIDSN